MIICKKCGHRNYFKPGDEIVCKECGASVDNRKSTQHFYAENSNRFRVLHEDSETIEQYSGFYSYPDPNILSQNSYE